MRGPTPIFNARWLVIALCIVALSVLAGVCETYYVLPRIYSATAEIEILPPADVASARGFSPVRDVEIMKTRLFLAPVITDLELDRIWAKRVYHTKLSQLPMQDAVSYLE